MSLIFREIKEATSLNDLQDVLGQIPLNAVKSFAISEYQKMSKKEQQAMQSKMLNPNKIFPDDLIQNILSFDYISQTRPVCKLWKKVCRKIEDNQSKVRKEAIKAESKTFHSDRTKLMPAVSRTFVVDPSRSKLTEEEQRAAYLGPYPNPQELLSEDESQDGDRILIHSGTYIMDSFEICSQIQLIGVGSEVILKYSGNVILDADGMSEHCHFIEIHGESVYFENMQIQCRGEIDFWGCVSCAEGAVWMKDCSIFCSSYSVKIDMYVGFQALNCRFSSGVEIESPSNDKFVLIGCEFRIDPFDDYYFVGTWVSLQCHHQAHIEPHRWPQLECIGNSFELNVTGARSTYPFSMEHGTGDSHEGYHCAVPVFRLVHNKVESTYQENRIVDGNTLYRFCYKKPGQRVAIIKCSE